MFNELRMSIRYAPDSLMQMQPLLCLHTERSEREVAGSQSGVKVRVCKMSGQKRRARWPKPEHLSTLTLLQYEPRCRCYNVSYM